MFIDIIPLSSSFKYENPAEFVPQRGYLFVDLAKAACLFDWNKQLFNRLFVVSYSVRASFANFSYALESIFGHPKLRNENRQGLPFTPRVKPLVIKITASVFACSNIRDIAVNNPCFV